MTTNLAFGEFCKLSVIGALLLLLINGASCQQQQQQEQTQQQQQHQQQQHHAMQSATRATLGNRWNRRQAYPTAAASSSVACDYKELLSSLHDRVGVLATLDEDQRNRLEALSKKIVQFETSNLARLDSLGVKQLEFLKRLESLDLLQRMTKREVEQLQQSLIEGNAGKQTKKVAHDDAHDVGEHDDSKSTEVNNDLSSAAQRRQRQAPDQNLSDSDKLDALSTLLVSTRSALNTLQMTVESDMTRVLQETNKLNRRITNLQRRQMQSNNNQHPGQFYGYLASGQTTPANEHLVRSCAQGAPTSHGILRLQLTEKSEPFYVRCDEEYMNGGWTIVQNRYAGDLNFQRDWSEYKSGFGNLASEFFIGLDKLHALTSNAVQELIIVLEDMQGVQRYAKYNLFAIGNEAESYTLNLLGDYEGDAGDSFSYHAGSKFSTYDNDNDGCVECNCAQAHLGAWWYNWCEQSNLNGKYYAANATIPRYTGMYWHSFHGPNISLKAARMMIRPVVLEQDNQR